jgi:hypothetical protein
VVDSIGYDTLHISLTRDQVGENAFYTLEDRLVDPVEVRSIRRANWDHPTLRGQVSGLTLTRSPQMIKIRGSLAHYHHQNRHSLLTADEVLPALLRLSDEVGFEIGPGSIKRLDLAMDLIVKHKPMEYLSAMLHMPERERSQDPHSVRWVNKVRCSTGYDKGEDLIRLGAEVPENWQNQNVLRFEMRILQRVSRILNFEVQAHHLADPGLFDHLVDLLIKDYQSIFKMEKMANPMKAKTPKELKEAGYAQFLRGLGPQGIEAWLETQEFERPEYKSRARKEIEKLLSTNQELGLVSEIKDIITMVLKNKV